MCGHAEINAERILDEPIIRPHMDGRMGDNINGPSLIRMPDWACGLGRYHLYFSDHKGKYIRLAYADALTGPWRMHEPGALHLDDSLFPSGDLPEPPPEDRPPWAAKMVGGYLYTHIASPDVHIDEENRRFRMYYHGLVENGDQFTRVAYSDDGIAFTPKKPMLGPPYFRVAPFSGALYTVAWGGGLWRGSDWDAPFEEGPQIIPFDVKGGIGEGFRHGETRVIDGRLHLFFHRMGDRPESILHTIIDTSAPDWRDWRAGEITTLLAPELEWEGADLPLATSVMGANTGRARELRDPCYFEDADGARYFLYCGAGESGIGIARLTGFA